ncbi:MAG TPA: prolyl oligopeptidase family serine peptidase [Gemmatimonadaceae bacterium]|nr:prolyl oligopeptidase family serine peptidase [Gemmatimonadaceae bacterium]
MITYFTRTACVASLAVATLIVAEPSSAQQRYSVDDFMTVTGVREYLWAPDSKTLYFTNSAINTGTAEIFRTTVAGGNAVQLTGTIVPELQTTPVANRAEPKDNLVLSPDGSRLFFTSSRYFQAIDNIYSMSTAGGPAVQHTFNDAVIETFPAPSPDGKTLAFFSRTARGTKINLLDLQTPRAWPRLFAPGADQEREPVWSPDGKTLAFTRAGDVWIQAITGGTARRLAGAPFPPVTSPVWSPDGARIAVTANQSGFSQIAVVNVASGAVTAITYAARENTAPSWSPDGRTIVFATSDGIGLSTQIAIAPSDGSGEPKLLTTGRGIRSSPQFSPDGSSVAYLESTATRASDIWLLPSTGGKPHRVTSSMGNIDPERLSVPEEVTFNAVDNLPLRALVFRPPNFDAKKKYPVIIALHGHPGQWNHSMNLLWQSVVAQGFVLIAPNPRGSVGMGAGFHDLHVGDYGGTEFEDIMSSVAYLRTLPFVDMTRKATWGGSGGGYMSLVLATQVPDTFRAQIIRAPVSSWKWLAMERYISPGRFATANRDPQRAREEFGGAYTDIPERYDERSPLNFVENVKVPQLLMQGLRDGSVPPNESRRWAQRMRELKKGDLITYVEYPDEEHSLLRYRATLRDQMVRIPLFLATHLELPEMLARLQAR